MEACEGHSGEVCAPGKSGPAGNGVIGAGVVNGPLVGGNRVVVVPPARHGVLLVRPPRAATVRLL